MDEMVRMGFSFPKKLKDDLENLARDYGIKLMGYVKLVIKEKVTELKKEENNE